MRKRTNGVHGNRYVLHISRDGMLTLCGRTAANVNIYPPGTEQPHEEQCCRACAKRAQVAA